MFTDAVKDHLFYVLRNEMSSKDFKELQILKTSDLKILLMFVWVLLAILTGLYCFDLVYFVLS